METMFFPRSIAIIGVSNSPSNNGRVIVENMERFGFDGIMHLVGGRRDSLSGRTIFAHVSEIPETPDLAVILVPASRLLEVLEACGEKGIRRVVIETGGFSEFGDDRKDLEGEIVDMASKWNMKVIGPNCVGIVNVENGLILPFYPLYPSEAGKGRVSIISQSGGLVHDIIVLANIDNVGVNKLVSIGNKLVSDENDVLEYLISDTDTGIIGLYLENIADGRRLMDLARSTDKPIVLLKSNRSPGSREIARFHTSALAGDDRVVDEALKQAGVHRVRDLGEMVDAFKAFSLPPLKGPSLAVIARSGGQAVLSADSVYLHGFTLASFSERFFAMLSEKTRAGVIRRTNPLDLGDVFDFDVYLAIIEEALREDGVDAVLMLHSYALGVDFQPSVRLMSGCGELVKKYGKPVVFCTIVHKENWTAMHEIKDLPVFTYVDDALAALRKSLDHFAPRPDKSTQTVKYSQKRTSRSRLAKGIVPVGDVFGLLHAYNLEVADYRIVNAMSDGLGEGRNMGFPLALKTASAEVLHKTEQGGVFLGLRDDAGLEEAFRKLGKPGPYLLQKMVPPGCEMIIGGRNDPEFGSVVMCGMGGIFVEIYKDVAVRVVPVDEREASAMVDDLKGVDILKGFRGSRPYDIEFLVDALVNVSRLLCEHPEIGTLDINPLILFGKGEGGVVVDAKLEIT